MNNDTINEELDAGEMASIIYEAISTSDPKLMKYTPDALMRVFVLLSKYHSWDLEKMELECMRALKYYYNNDV